MWFVYYLSCKERRDTQTPYNQRGIEMTADITYARGNNSTECKIPLYDAPKGTPFSEIPTFPIANECKIASGEADSILSVLAPKDGFTDIEGATVRMVTSIGGKQYEDVVTMVGVKQSSYVVRINDRDYAVRKSIARFCVSRE